MIKKETLAYYNADLIFLWNDDHYEITIDIKKDLITDIGLTPYRDELAEKLNSLLGKNIVEAKRYALDESYLNLYESFLIYEGNSMELPAKTLICRCNSLYLEDIEEGEFDPKDFGQACGTCLENLSSFFPEYNKEDHRYKNVPHSIWYKNIENHLLHFFSEQGFSFELNAIELKQNGVYITSNLGDNDIEKFLEPAHQHIQKYVDSELFLFFQTR